MEMLIWFDHSEMMHALFLQGIGNLAKRRSIRARHSGSEKRCYRHNARYAPLMQITESIQRIEKVQINKMRSVIRDRIF